MNTRLQHQCPVEGCTVVIDDGKGMACDKPGHKHAAAVKIANFDAGIPNDWGPKSLSYNDPK